MFVAGIDARVGTPDYHKTYAIESYLFQRAMEKQDISVLTVASDYDIAETGALRTRIETFVETLERG